MLAPGPIANTEGMSRLSTKGEYGQFINAAPAGRDGDIKDIANATVFLFSPAARYISGQVLAVDGAFEHIRPIQLPYPQAVLDPESVAGLIKPRL